MTKVEPLDPTTLLAQAGWVRRLAGRLLFDADAADDVAQETLAAALHGGPDDPHTLRSWLAGIVRNLARARTRSEAHRAEREAEARLPTPQPPAADVVARGESHRLVVEAVLELREPLRSTILMRYFDGLSTAQIAERTGTSAGAIRTRHSRAMALLRDDLDRRHGADARTWLAALISLTRPDSASSSSFPPLALPVVTAGGSLLMSTKTLLATPTIVPALVLAGLWVYSERALRTPSRASLPRAVQETAAPGSVAAIASPTSRQVLPASAQTTPSAAPHRADNPSALDPAPDHVRGRVIDLASQPIGGVTVELRPSHGGSGLTTTSENDGSFEIPIDESHGTLVAGDEQYTSVFHAMFTGFGGSAPGSGWRPLTLVVAPSGHFEGEVVDAEGRPVSGAELRVEQPQELRAKLDAVLDNSMPEVRTASADAAGRFALVAGRVPGSRLIASKTGFQSTAIELPGESAFDLRLVLGHADDSLLLGRVVDALAAPIAGAHVAFGLETVTADQDGRFQFHLRRLHYHDALAGEPRALVALHPGFLPVRVEKADQPGGAWGSFVSLELSEQPASIEGKLLRPDGKPLEGARVYLLNPTFFGTVESMMSADAEQILNENAGPDRRLDTTDANGSFVVRGLFSREYRLLAIEPRTLRRVTSRPISAPAKGVVIELEGHELSPVAGRVIDRNGAPMPGLIIAVNIVRPSERVGSPFDGASPDYFHTDIDALTGADGRFSLREMDPTDVELQIYRAGFVANFHYELGQVDGPLDQLEIVAYRGCHFFVDLAQRADLADSFGLLDETGATVPLVIGRGDMTMHVDDAQLIDGRSEIISASERASVLVLYKAHRVVERVPIVLSPDKTQRIGL